MRLMIAALAVTLAIAIVAAVFAIWPVVADAPWEDEIVVPTPVVVDRTDDIRCQGGIDLRERAMFESSSQDVGLARLRLAQDEIDAYC